MIGMRIKLGKEEEKKNIRINDRLGIGHIPVSLVCDSNCSAVEGKRACA